MNPNIPLGSQDETPIIPNQFKDLNSFQLQIHLIESEPSLSL
jgi:hypothetical protein